MWKSRGHSKAWTGSEAYQQQWQRPPKLERPERPAPPGSQHLQQNSTKILSFILRKILADEVPRFSTQTAVPMHHRSIPVTFAGTSGAGTGTGVGTGTGTGTGAGPGAGAGAGVWGPGGATAAGVATTGSAATTAFACNISNLLALLFLYEHDT